MMRRLQCPGTIWALRNAWSSLRRQAVCIARTDWNTSKRPSQQTRGETRQPRNVHSTREDFDWPIRAAWQATSVDTAQDSALISCSAASYWIEAPVVVARTVMRLGQLMFGGETGAALERDGSIRAGR